jgi:hypothetical protein
VPRQHPLDRHVGKRLWNCSIICEISCGHEDSIPELVKEWPKPRPDGWSYRKNLDFIVSGAGFEPATPAL